MHAHPLFDKLLGSPFIRENERVLVMLPRALPVDLTDKVLVEAHVFKQTFLAAMLANGRGQSVEIRGDRVLTGLGFAQQRVCQVLGWENVTFEAKTVRICVLDKPLYGDFEEAEDQAVERRRATLFNGGGPCEWLAVAPLIETGFFDRLQFTKKTFLLIEGYEKETATRIRQIAQVTGSALLEVEPSFRREAEAILTDIERAAYASLHSWLFPHLVAVNATKDGNLKKKLSALPSAESLMTIFQAPKELQNKKAVAAVISRCSADFRGLDEIISPHQKLSALTRLSTAMGTLFSELCGSSSGEHLVTGFIILVKEVNLTVFFPHVSHMEMLLAAHPNTLALGQGAYALSAFLSAMDFLATVVYNPGRTRRSDLLFDGLAVHP